MPTHPPVHVEDEAEAGGLSPAGVPGGQHLTHHDIPGEQALQGRTGRKEREKGKGERK
jgi:hypothetical protein